MLLAIQLLHVFITPCFNGPLTKINLQSALTGRRIKELCGHHHAVVDCRVPTEGVEDRLLSASWDKTARLWDINSYKQLVYNQSCAAASLYYMKEGSLLTSQTPPPICLNHFISETKCTSCRCRPSYKLFFFSTLLCENCNICKSTIIVL